MDLADRYPVAFNGINVSRARGNSFAVLSFLANRNSGMPLQSQGLGICIPKSLASGFTNYKKEPGQQTTSQVNEEQLSNPKTTKGKASYIESLHTRAEADLSLLPLLDADTPDRELLHMSRSSIRPPWRGARKSASGFDTDFLAPQRND